MADSQPQKKPGKRRGWLIALVLIVLIGAGAWYFWAQRSADEQAADSTAFMVPKVPVRITQVTEGELQERLRAIGTVEAFNIVTVRSRVEGELLEIYFKDGQFVEAGDGLDQADPERYEQRASQ